MPSITLPLGGLFSGMDWVVVEIAGNFGASVFLLDG
jgi:hypothetical protein